MKTEYYLKVQRALALIKQAGGNMGKAYHYGNNEYITTAQWTEAEKLYNHNR